MNNYININNITKIYKLNNNIEVKALNNISFSLNDKGIVFIVGKSGCGKSTLLNILSGLDEPTNGTVSINGELVDYKNEKYLDKHRNENVGFIFQDHHLMDNFTIKENMKMPLHIQNNKISDDKVSEVLDLVGLKEVQNRFPNEISGGQRQRVSIARALIKNPKIILADEPTGNLDSNTSKQIFELLTQISKEKLVVVVTHDLDSAYLYGDRILELKDGKLINDRLKVSDFNLNAIKEKYDTEVNKSYKINESKYEAPKYSTTKLKHYKYKLSFKDAFNIMLGWLKKGLVPMLISTIILSIVLTAFGIFYNINSYSSGSAIKTTLLKNNVGTALLLNTSLKEDKDYIKIEEKDASDLLFTKETIEPISNEFDDVFKSYYINAEIPTFVNEQGNNKISSICELGDVVNEKELLKFYNSKLVLGTYPKYNNNAIEILISNKLAEDFLRYGANFTNGTVYPNTSANNLIGKTFEFNLISFKIVGIYECSTNKTYENTNLYANLEEDYYNYYVYPVVLTANNTINTFLSEKPFLYVERYTTASDYGYNYSFGVIGIDTLEEVNNISNLSSIPIKFGNHESNTIEDGEVVISFSRYFYLFNDKIFTGNGAKTFEDLTEENIKSLYFSQRIYIGGYAKRFYKIIGIYDDTNFDSSLLICNNATKNEFLNDYTSMASLYINIKADKSFVNKLYDYTTLNKMTIYTASTDALIFFNSLFLIIKKIINGATIIIFIFLVILFSSVISKNIKQKEKEIGILRAMGAGKLDLIKIFVINNFFYIALSSVISTILYIIGCRVVNNSISLAMGVGLSVISGDIISVLLMLAASILVITLSSLLPIFKYSKTPPINVIKGIK